MSGNASDYINIFKQLGNALSSISLYQNICFKPKQVQCFDLMLRDFDTVAVLPTGYGKLLIFQLLPYVLPQKSVNNKANLFIVVCPLSSIIKDQIGVLNASGVKASMLTNSLFETNLNESSSLFRIKINKKIKDENKNNQIKNITEADFSILFTHPESLLSPKGRELLKSNEFKERVVACAIDEAHCIETWYVYVMSFLVILNTHR